MATKITFKTLLPCIQLVAKKRKPILARGPHGIGKSEVIYQFAQTARKSLGLKPNTKAIQREYGIGPDALPVVERRASQMPDAGDLMGLPELDSEVTNFKPMSWFYQACTMPVVLFFDEVDRANQDVRQALFELTDSRKIAGQVLHPDTIIIACVNGGEGDSQYVVGEMDPAELDRWAVFDLEPSFDDWREWAEKDDRVDPIIVDFLKQNRVHLEHSGDFEPNKVYPSRRSWVRLNDTLRSEGYFDDNDNQTAAEKKAANEILFYIAQSYVGQEAAIALQDFLRNYQNNLVPEDILKGRRRESWSKLDTNQQLALIDKLKKHNALQKKMDQGTVDNLSRFLFSLDHEVVMLLWAALSEGENSNGIAFHQSVVDGKSVSMYIARILGAQAKPKEGK